MRVIISDYLKALLQYILPKQRLTIFAGIMANNQNPATKNKLIRYFINKYKVNMNEALEENIDAYPTFNAFFIRHLKPQCRPIANADVISPVDGYISEIGDIKQGMLLQAKGRDYSLEKLLACDPTLSQQFNGGLFATLYLSPQDYHRVHMPIEGILKEMTYVPGKLFSVQPATARVIPKLFACNERLVVIFETSVGLMAMVLVGATIVGAIGTTWAGDIPRGQQNRHTTYPQPLLLKKGEEMGYFKLGSTVILLFAEKHRLQWEMNLSAGDKIRFGQAFGTIYTNGIE